MSKMKIKNLNSSILVGAFILLLRLHYVSGFKKRNIYIMFLLPTVHHLWLKPIRNRSRRWFFFKNIQKEKKKMPPDSQKKREKKLQYSFFLNIFSTFVERREKE